MRTLKIYSILVMAFLCFGACANEEMAGEVTGKMQRSNQSELPVLDGLLVYHHYTSYEAGDSEILLYNFKTNVLKVLSAGWNIQHPMNAHLSPDGKSIVFMGIDPSDYWCVYRYVLDSNGAPEILTPDRNTRNEDPKYSYDGKTIVFKQSGQLAEMDLATKKITLLTSGSNEYSMPYYSLDNKKIVYSMGARENASIGVYDKATKKTKNLYNRVNILEYYPVTADSESFYYSASFSESKKADQLYRGYWTGKQSVRLPFNDENSDFSDACPVNSQWLILSSTRPGTKGVYDLYIANVVDGSIYSLSAYNEGINSDKWELGASVYIKK